MLPTCINWCPAGRDCSWELLVSVSQVDCVVVSICNMGRVPETLIVTNSNGPLWGKELHLSFQFCQLDIPCTGSAVTSDPDYVIFHV